MVVPVTFFDASWGEVDANQYRLENAWPL